MPEENYSFKPTPEVRTFGQLVGHVADASYMFCSQVMVKQTQQRKSKNEDVKGGPGGCAQGRSGVLQQAFEGMTDAKGSQMVKLFNFDLAKLTVFSINTAHTDEHYGNMVTYLRLKGSCRRQVKISPHRHRSKRLEHLTQQTAMSW